MVGGAKEAAPALRLEGGQDEPGGQGSGVGGAVDRVSSSERGQWLELSVGPKVPSSALGREEQEGKDTSLCWSEPV